MNGDQSGPIHAQWEFQNCAGLSTNYKDNHICGVS